MNNPQKLFLHAPNVHVGGGLTLLKALYSAPELSIYFEQVDTRAIQQLPPSLGERHYVRPSLFSRLAAEVRLWRRVAKDDLVLCFHGLVPLFPLKGEVVVFLQNRILLTEDSLQDYPLKTRVRLSVERLMVKRLARRVKRFIVQTPSMAVQAQSFLGPGATVVICPFVVATPASVETLQDKRFDYVYVASADHHKNHHKLLEAWCLLAQQNVRPRLALTVSHGSSLAMEIERLKEQWQLNVVNFGHVSPLEVTALYDQSTALIYPSTTESLGLPLIEANERGLPIIAAELDYVRDVVEPVQTFDPDSPVSIARAVKRHLRIVECPQPVHGPEVFLKEVLR
ncbi:glycosyltransferase [Pseudomonas sp. C9]|uniref:glycosyltransferase n=1 Tax=Pseudomonas sp. C9 TaxID=1311337 RepID=UPI0011159E10|nr:glycosyltransferase [Pseudomonas sp. C9]